MHNKHEHCLFTGGTGSLKLLIVYHVHAEVIFMTLIVVQPLKKTLQYIIFTIIVTIRHLLPSSGTGRKY